MPGNLSQLIGQHRCNLDWLRERFPLQELRVRPAEVPEGELYILSQS